MSWLVKTRAFGVGGNLQHLLDDSDPEAKVNTTLGGRVDVARLFDDIKVVGSITVRQALPLSSLKVNPAQTVLDYDLQRVVQCGGRH